MWSDHTSPFLTEWDQNHWNEYFWRVAEILIFCHTTFWAHLVLKVFINEISVSFLNYAITKTISSMILWCTYLLKAISLWASFWKVIQGDISNRTSAELKIHVAWINFYDWHNPKNSRCWKVKRTYKAQSVPLLFSKSTFYYCQNPKTNTFLQSSMSYIQRSTASHFLNTFFFGYAFEMFSQLPVYVSPHQLSRSIWKHFPNISQRTGLRDNTWTVKDIRLHLNTSS